MTVSRNGYLMRTYGITEGDWEKMWKAQGERCAICGKKPRKSRPSTDHDHWIEKRYGAIVINGIICQRCNEGLGRFEYDNEVLTALVKYATLILKRRTKYQKEEPLSGR